jgi:ornithine cyclodeaminase/alanine dehydrogenase-like protein (mu-crystallin family)
MPASRDEPPGVGAKLVAVFPNNRAEDGPRVRSLYVLFDPVNGAPVAAMDAEYLTQIRTAVASAVATAELYSGPKTSVAIFGTGTQAWGHARVFASVLGFRSILVVGRVPKHTDAFVERLGTMGVSAVAVDGRDALRRSHVVVTATTSKAPVLEDDAVLAGSHINAIGTFQPDAAELPQALVARSRVVVDTLDAIRTSGDLAGPVANGIVTEEAFSTELSDVMLGTRQGRCNETEITIYKSVGTSFLDIAVAQVIFARAVQRGVGRRFDFGTLEGTLEPARM